MRWIDALREWNTGSGKWCIPKKGTEEYDAVRALMGEKEPKAKAPKAEKAPKEAKAPKASLQDMAAAVGVPMKQMKASAADYYKRVDNADPESRALLMERMPAQLRAGWEKHLASKAPKDAPAVRRVLKKKPVMVAVPEAPPAPAPAFAPEVRRVLKNPVMVAEMQPARVNMKSMMDSLLKPGGYYNELYQDWKNAKTKAAKKKTEHAQWQIPDQVYGMMKSNVFTTVMPQEFEEMAVDYYRKNLNNALEISNKNKGKIDYRNRDAIAYYADHLRAIEERQYTNMIWEMDSRDSNAYNDYIVKTKAEDNLSTLKKWAEKNDINLY